MRTFFLLAMAFSISSCATIFTGTSSVMSFKSSVPAVVELDGAEIGKTPLTMSIPKSFGGVVSVKAKGYERKDLYLVKEFNAVSVLNLVNPLGWVIDYVSGAMFDFSKKSYDVDLEKKGE